MTDMDVKDRLNRIADRVADRKPSLAELDRARTRRTARRRIGAGVVGLTIGAVGLLGIAVWSASDSRTQLAVGGGLTPSPSPTMSCPDARSTPLVLRGLAFEVDCLSAPAGETFDLHFENRDQGIPHNLSLAAVRDCEVTDGGSNVRCPPESVIVQSEVETGDLVAVIEIPPLRPGDYYFYCDVHSYAPEFGRLTVT